MNLAMKFGITLPNTLDARSLAELARQAEESGWDGIFIWDCIDCEPGSTYDTWITLAAIAMQTERIRIGTLLTAVTRRRPWKLARETVTLDHLSGGRLILTVGLGSVDCGEFAKVNEITDRLARAHRLDEGLEILTGLWSGQPFSYNGDYYQVRDMTFLPRPVQVPRIPIWVVGAWPRKKSMRRVLRYDGVLPSKMGADNTFAELTPEDIRAIKAYIGEHRAMNTPYEIVMDGKTRGDDQAQASSIVRPFAEAGLTWWIEDEPCSTWRRGGVDGLRTRIRQGPPHPK